MEGNKVIIPKRLGSTTTSKKIWTYCSKKRHTKERYWSKHSNKRPNYKEKEEEPISLLTL